MCAIKLNDEERTNNNVLDVQYLLSTRKVPDRRFNKQHFDLEAYFDEVNASKEELEKRRAIRKDKSEKRTWVHRTLQVSALIILAMVLGLLTYGHLVFVSQLILSGMWTFTLTYSFWKKRERFYNSISKLPKKIKWSIQILGLAYRILYLPIMLLYIIWRF